jgi:hypothetical protein
MNWPTATLILGFVLFLCGFLALILSLVGLQFSFLAFLDSGGPTAGFVARLLMIFGGVTLMYVARSKFEK